MARHPHYELMKEWIEDTSRVVQYRDPTDVYDWNDIERPAWRPDMEYRFKPEPKQDVVQTFFCDQHQHIWTFEYAKNYNATKPNLKLTFDGETGELKSAEVIR